LLTDEKMKIRSTYAGFTNAVSRYFDHLLPLLASYQVILFYIYTKNYDILLPGNLFTDIYTY